MHRVQILAILPWLLLRSFIGLFVNKSMSHKIFLQIFFLKCKKDKHNKSCSLKEKMW